MITLTVVVTLAISGGAMLTGSYLIMRWIFASDSAISPLFFVHSRSLLSLCSFSHRFSALWAGTEGQCGDVTPHCPSVRGSRRS